MLSIGGVIIPFGVGWVVSRELAITFDGTSLVLLFRHFELDMGNRSLSFSDLRQILPEVYRLRDEGYTQTGSWDLMQTCEHLADWMSFPLDGFPKQPWFIAWMFPIMRLTFGKSSLRKILTTGEMGKGMPTMPETVYKAGGSLDKAIERLAASIERLSDSQGPFHPSPVFGKLGKEELVRLQLVHCGHHLAFLNPNR